MEEEVKHQRVISQLRKYSDKSDFWILIDFGEIYFKKSDQLFYRDADFVSSSSSSYDLKKWDRSNVIRIELTETKTLLFNLGTIFNYKGLPVCEPKEDSEYLNIYKIVISNDRKNHEITTRDKVFVNTNYPIYVNDDIKNDFFYHKRIFQKNSTRTANNNNTVENDKKEGHEIQKSSEYIIPNDLIRKRFYYKSYSGINTLLLNKLRKGILKKSIVNDRWMVQYDSEFIKKTDLIYLAKYWFTQEVDSNSKSGLELLNGQLNKFRKKLLKNSQKSVNYIHSTLNFPIPFSFPIEVKILGQWITEFESNEKKFIAYKILSFSRYKTPDIKIGESPFYSVDGLIAIDVNDKTSTDQRENKDIKESASRIISDSGNKELIYDEENKPTNSNLEPITTKLIEDENVDGFELDVNFIPREDQDFAHITNLFLKQAVEGLSDNLEHSDTGSLLQKNNVIKDRVTSFECIMNAMEILKKKYNLFNYQFITINNSINTPYSELLINFSGKRKIQTLDAVLIIKVVFNDFEYCIIESGAGKCIGIFKNLGLPFNDQNDSNLSNFLNFVILEYNYLWSSFYTEKNAKLTDNNLQYIAEKTKKHRLIRDKFKYDILRPIYHKSTVKEDMTIEEDLAQRIYSRVKTI